MADEAVAEVVEEEIDIVEDVELDEAEAEPEETETAESEETAKEEPEPEESSTSKKDDGFQKRIDELTTRFYNQKQEADFYKQQLEDATKAVESVAPGKTLADFEYDEAQYASYLQDQAKVEARADVERNAQQHKIMQRRAEFEMKEASFATDIEDYQIVTRNPALPINEAIVETLQSAEKGPEVLYYLGKHPDVAASLSQMSPLDAARELGKIEATKLVKPEPPISKTPEPPPKIKGSDTAAVRIRSDSPESDKLSDAEWLKLERKRLATKDK
jgi:hypothetical protein